MFKNNILFLQNNSYTWCDKTKDLDIYTLVEENFSKIQKSNNSIVNTYVLSDKYYVILSCSITAPNERGGRLAYHHVVLFNKDDSISAKAVEESLALRYGQKPYSKISVLYQTITGAENDKAKEIIKTNYLNLDDLRSRSSQDAQNPSIEDEKMFSMLNELPPNIKNQQKAKSKNGESQMKLFQRGIIAVLSGGTFVLLILFLTGNLPLNHYFNIFDYDERLSVLEKKFEVLKKLENRILINNKRLSASENKFEVLKKLENRILTMEGELQLLKSRIVELTSQKEVRIKFNLVGAIKYIIKDVPETTYPPYHDQRRILPSKEKALYDFSLSKSHFPKGLHLKRFEITFSREYHAESDYDPAALRFDVRYPPTRNSSEKVISTSISLQGSLKSWKDEFLRIQIKEGVPPSYLRIYVTESGDFALLLKNMQVVAVFGKK